MRQRRRRRTMSLGLGALCLAAAFAGCATPASIECTDGRVCPSGSTCDVDHHLCIGDAQTQACDGKGDGDNCQFGGQVGRCDMGVCLPTACGNGIVDTNEVCDDGNADSGDGCRGDCAKIEMCGDGVVDAGEACDDGNLNPVDGCDQCVANTWQATTLLGGNPTTSTWDIGQPEHVTVAFDGTMYIGDPILRRVYRVSHGIVSVVAGTGAAGASTDGILATESNFDSPRGVAIDGLGNLYISNNQRIHRVDSKGILTTIARDPVVEQPEGLAVDGLGNVYFVDQALHRLGRIDAIGNVEFLVNGGFGSSGDGGTAVSAQLNSPQGIAVAPTGEIYIADTGNHRIRRIDINGDIDTVAGSSQGYSGDGLAATAAQLDFPTGVTVAADGSFYIADSLNHAIRRVSPQGTITTIAGGVGAGFSGDGGAASAALLNGPIDVTLGPDGTIYIADQLNDRIRSISAGVITTFAGGAEGGAASTFAIDPPTGVAFDSQGHLYYSVSSLNRVFRVELDGTLTRFAGTGVAGGAGDGGAARQATLQGPTALLFDSQGNLLISDSDNHVIRSVSPAGTISLVAGNYTPGTATDNVAPTATSLYTPRGLAFDLAGNLVIADYDHHRIRRIAGGVITTIAGTGTAGYNTDSPPITATGAQLSHPMDVVYDSAGRLYIADDGNARVRMVDAGKISTVVGGGTIATLSSARSVAVDAQSRLLISDVNAGRVYRLDSGALTTLAGVNVIKPALNGDGGPATAAPIGAIDMLTTAGGLVVADRTRHVRIIDTTGRILSLAGQFDPDGVGPVAVAHLADPRQIVEAGAVVLFAGGTSGTIEALGATRLDAVAGRYANQSDTANLARFRSTTFGAVLGIAYEQATSKVYITSSNAVYAITIVDAADPKTWTITTLAGTPDTAGFLDGDAVNAKLDRPSGLYLDPTSRILYVADTGNQVVRAIDLGSNNVTTLAGTPRTRGYSGDGGVPTSARLNNPVAVTRCANGDLFIADTENHRVRRIKNNTISTVLGDGSPSSSGEGAPASSFSADSPAGLACDAANNLYVTSRTAVRLLPQGGGIVDGSGPVKTIFGAQPRTTFPSSVTSCLTGIRSVDASTLHVTDSCTGLLIELKLGAL